MKVTYKSMILEDANFDAVRRDLYNSDGPGYYVFPSFISEEQAHRIYEYYTNSIKPNERFKGFLSFRHLYKNCPNYYLPQNTKDNLTFMHFFWNDPPHESLHSIAFQVQILRNIIETSDPFREIFPLSRKDTGGKSSPIKFNCSYRFNLDRNGSPVPMHQDWMINFDPRRLQGTLFLSQKEVDYKGQGFIFTKNNGDEIVLADEYSIVPGDLVFWRFNNAHAVKNIQSDPNQKGFVRILFPLEKIYEKAPFMFSLPNLSAYIYRELSKNIKLIKAVRKARSLIFDVKTPE
jgi:hypothetical protein